MKARIALSAASAPGNLGFFARRSISAIRGRKWMARAAARWRGVRGCPDHHPTPRWTVAANVDETVNVSNQTTLTNLSLNTSAPSAIFVPIGRSVRVTSAAVRNSYDISELWSAFGTIGYVHAEYLDFARRDDAWLADLQVRYQMFRNLFLSWEYQYSKISSTVQLSSSRRNFVAMSATYNY